MLIFLVPIVICFLAVALVAMGCTKGTKFSHWCYRHDIGLSTLAFFSLVILAIMIIVLAVSHINYASFPAKYEAVTITLAESREVGSSDIERAAVVHKIIDMNKEIAAVKYWNGSIWVGWFFPDRVANLELIK